jgi:hypothetical protein
MLMGFVGRQQRTLGRGQSWRRVGRDCWRSCRLATGLEDVGNGIGSLSLVVVGMRWICVAAGGGALRLLELYLRRVLLRGHVQFVLLLTRRWPWSSSQRGGWSWSWSWSWSGSRGRGRAVGVYTGGGSCGVLVSRGRELL